MTEEGESKDVHYEEESCPDMPKEQYHLKFFTKDNPGVKNINVEFYYLLKTPSHGKKTTFIILAFYEYPLIKKNWVDIVIRANEILEQRFHIPSLDTYSHKIVSINISKGPKYLSKMRYSRQDILYLTHTQGFKSETKFTLTVFTQNSEQRQNLGRFKLKWRSRMDLSVNTPHKFIGLPGYIYKVILENIITNIKSSLTFFWIHDNFDKFNHYADSEPKLCNNVKPIPVDDTYCLNYSSVNRKKKKYYFIYYCKIQYQQRLIRNQGGKVKLSFKWLLNLNKVSKSWIEATSYCKSIGGHLPIIRDKNELAELTSVLKLPKDMPPIQALYIGLIKSSKHKV